jgi:hypothetical protein
MKIGVSSQVEIGGFSGTQIDVAVVNRGLLYEPDRTSNCLVRGGRYPWLEVGPMRIVVLDTSAGTLCSSQSTPQGKTSRSFSPSPRRFSPVSPFPDLD